MALDTATKRRSMFAMGLVALVVQPIPDGTIADVDQRHFLGLSAARAAQAGLATDFLHIFSTGVVEPVSIADSGSNVLVAGDTEVQGDAYTGGTEWVTGDLNVTGNVQIDGRTVLNALFVDVVRVTSSPYAVSTTDHTIMVDTDSGAIIVNLPGSAGTGRHLRIVNVGSSDNDVTVTPDGAELLTGANASRTLSDRSVIILENHQSEGWW
jgi:hypothetical protein